jgi:broad specificity phosphatase PhoE
MRIYLVRHGQSETLAGISEEIDCPLTPRGLEQAGAIAAALAGAGLTQILTSPFRRCLQTAEVLRRVTGASAELWPAVHEHHHEPYPAGEWPLPTRSEIAAAFPDFLVPPGMPETHWAAVPEDRERQWQRISNAVRSLLERHEREPDAAVAVLTHGAPASVFVQSFCMWPNPLRVGVRIDPGTISILEVEPGGRRVLVRLNWPPEPVR